MFSYRYVAAGPCNILLTSFSFPLDVVFRIYDNVLASGIEAIFGFSVALLAKNEDILLGLKFDEILGFMNTKLFDRYKLDGDQFNVDEFVQDATSLRITPFQLDSYSHEYDDLMVCSYLCSLHFLVLTLTSERSK